MNSLSKSYAIAKKKKALVLALICLSFALAFPVIAIVDSVRSFSNDYGDAVLIFVLWFPIWFAAAYVFYKWALTSKLVVSEYKIECDDIASLVGFSTAWDNIEYLQVSKMRLILFLKESSEPSTKLGRWVITHNWVNPKVIDLSSFIDHWTRGELKRDFERYAPHLFDEEGILKRAIA